MKNKNQHSTYPGLASSQSLHHKGYSKINAQFGPRDAAWRAEAEAGLVAVG